MSTPRTCPRCGGRGTGTDFHECGYCRGAGTVTYEPLPSWSARQDGGWVRHSNGFVGGSVWPREAGGFHCRVGLSFWVSNGTAEEARAEVDAHLLRLKMPLTGGSAL